MCRIFGARADTKAATRFMRKLLLVQSAAPRVMVTGQLGSYCAEGRELRLSVCDQRQHTGLNNRVENSHQPVRRERGL